MSSALLHFTVGADKEGLYILFLWGGFQMRLSQAWANLSAAAPIGQMLATPLAPPTDTQILGSSLFLTIVCHPN